MAKKSFNPFKLFGSYIGAGIPLIFFAYWAIFLCPHGVRGERALCVPVTVITGIIAIVIGFLMGWGIHSLIRRFKK